MSEFVGSLLLIAAVYIVVFFIKDIFANVFQYINLSNIIYLRGFRKKKRVHHHQLSTIKEKPSSHEVNLRNQSKQNRAEVVNLVDDVTIRFQPLPTKMESNLNSGQFRSSSEAKNSEKISSFEDQPFRNIPFLSSETEPITSAVGVTDFFDESTLEDINLYKEFKITPKPVPTKTKPKAIRTPSTLRSDEVVTEETYFYEDGSLISELPIPEAELFAAPEPSPQRSDDLVTEQTYLYEVGRLVAEPSIPETELLVTPAPASHRSDEVVTEETYHYENGKFVLQASSSEIKPSTTPKPSEHQLAEKITYELYSHEDSILVPEPAIAKITQAGTPLQSQSRSSVGVTERIAPAEGGKAPVDPSIVRSKPSATSLESDYQSDEAVVEKIIGDDEITIRSDTLVTGTKPTKTLVESHYQTNKKNAEDTIILDDIKTHLTPSTMESKSSVQTKPVEPAESLPLQSDEKSTIDNSFQGKKLGTTSLKKENQGEILLQFSHQLDKIGTESAISTKNIDVNSAASPPETKASLIIEGSNDVSSEMNNKTIDLYEDVLPRRKPSTTQSSPTATQAPFRSQPANLDKSDVENMIRKYDFHDIFVNPNGKNLLHRYTSLELVGDEIILDEATNLIWQQSGSSNDMTIENASNWLERLNRESYAGFQDWRFPTLEEAMSLMEGEKKNGDLFINPLFNKKQEVIWTSDFLPDKSQIWIVSLAKGFCDRTSLNRKNYVRAVRQDENFIRNLIL